jgi:uncharacterized membrane protein YukC
MCFSLKSLPFQKSNTQNNVTLNLFFSKTYFKSTASSFLYYIMFRCANCGPADWNYDETMSTLRYANRAKNIKNKPRINEDPKDAMLREFQEEIEKLKLQLAGQGGGGGGVGGSGGGGGQKIVERIVVKEVGVSKEEMDRIEEDLKREKDEMRKQNAEEVKRVKEESKEGMF